jgi:hypothetical protein
MRWPARQAHHPNSVTTPPRCLARSQTFRYFIGITIMQTALRGTVCRSASQAASCRQRRAAVLVRAEALTIPDGFTKVWVCPAQLSSAYPFSSMGRPCDSAVAFLLLGPSSWRSRAGEGCGGGDHDAWWHPAARLRPEEANFG